MVAAANHRGIDTDADRSRRRTARARTRAPRGQKERARDGEVGRAHAAVPAKPGPGVASPKVQGSLRCCPGALVRREGDGATLCARPKSTQRRGDSRLGTPRVSFCEAAAACRVAGGVGKSSSQASSNVKIVSGRRWKATKSTKGRGSWRPAESLVSLDAPSALPRSVHKMQLQNKVRLIRRPNSSHPHIQTVHNSVTRRAPDAATIASHTGTQSERKLVQQGLAHPFHQ